MRFATLVQKDDVRSSVGIALMSIGVEVSHFSAVDPLIASLDELPFDAIVVEDDERHIRPWLLALKPYVEQRIAVIAIGAGGAASMSIALLHGADDYVVIGEGVDQIVHRSIARINAKTRQAQRATWRLGPYSLDPTTSKLLSITAAVHLSPREFTLARVLIENCGKVVMLDSLCRVLCDREDETARRAVKQHAHTLRKKCELAAGPTLRRLRIEAVYGKGYRLSF
jgi:DNA-binding response OmpR family regulator